MQTVIIETPGKRGSELAPFLILRTLTAAQAYGDPVLEESARLLSSISAYTAQVDEHMCLAIDPGSGFGTRPHWEPAGGGQKVAITVRNDSSADTGFLRVVLVVAGERNVYTSIAPGDRRTFWVTRNLKRLLIKLANPAMSAQDEEVQGDPIGQIVGLHPATASLVAGFVHALATKLLESQVKYGYTDDWQTPGREDELRALMLEHLQKGDPRDVAAYCAFLWYHGARTCG